MTALRTFEASARLQSFKAAADELSVTPTAVSHQIKALESWLGVRLFERLARQVRLTESGERLFRATHEAFLDIAHTADQLRPMATEGQLTVSTTQAFAALWLVPRLGRFYAAHPQIALRIDTRCDIVHLHRDASIDVAIRYGSSKYPQLLKHRLLDECFAVYGNPEQLKHANSGKPHALIGVRCVDSNFYQHAWREWCKQAGVDWMAHMRMLEYDDESYAIQAAIAGQGLTLASSLLASESVNAGLLRPYRNEVWLSGSGYSALWVPGRERHPPLRAFLNWLQSETEAT